MGVSAPVRLPLLKLSEMDLKTSYVCGLDLGQVSDPTAFCVLERSPGHDGKQAYAVRYLHRFALGTPYTAPETGIAEQVKQLLARPPLPGCLLAADQTGVGRPVMDLFRTMQLPAALIPVSITAGSNVTFDPDDLAWHVPKKDLVGCLQVLLGTGRLTVASELSLAGVLKREMLAFRVKITPAGNETFAAWRDADHDDLVLAVALAAWVAERMPDFGKGSIGTGKRLAGVSADPLRDMPAHLREAPRLGG
jgi:hypothetical protein